MSVVYLGNQYIAINELGNNFVIQQQPYFPPLGIEYLLLAGGGAGGNSVGGGGGAGGFLTGSYITNFGTIFNVTIGAGGSNSNGINSTITLPISLTAIGGGKGANGNLSGAAIEGNSGGSGGGAGAGIFGASAAGGIGTTLQGKNGGSGSVSGGGGGGALTSGISGVPNEYAGAGGNGLQWLDGNNYAGGGGGATVEYFAQYTGSGGIGGGGNGGYGGGNASFGTSNTGGGGGGAGGESSISGNGGSGIAKFRYSGSLALCTGGIITQQSGYVYHTFISGSGSLIYTGIPTVVPTTTTTTSTTTTTAAPTTTTTSTSTTTAAPTTTCSGTGVGCYYQGGIVVYNSGGTILVAAESDLGQEPWGCLNKTISGANGTGYGDGESNTSAIVAAGCGGAAASCQNLTLNGYSDWYLPSINELISMRALRTQLGMTGEYWSSTQSCGFASNFYASSLEMSTGSNPCGYRTSSLKVRPLRKV